MIPEAAVTAAWIEADLPDDVTKDVARRILEAAAPHMALPVDASEIIEELRISGWHEAAGIVGQLTEAPMARRIYQVEDLDRMPMGVVIRDAIGAILERDQMEDGLWGWMSTGSSEPWQTDLIDLPATVLWEPAT